MSYAKTIFPYQTDVTGDLQLQVDDVVEILEQVDENWIRGKSKGKIGLVPCKFVQRLPTVDLKDDQSLYIAHTDYRSTHEGDLQFYRDDLLIVDEHLSNGWLHGSLHISILGSNVRPSGIFPNTFVTLIRDKLNKTETNSSQNDLLLFESNPVQFVRVICDRKPNESNELGCFEDETLAVIEGDINHSEWLTVKNAFNTIGRIKRIYVEPIDDKQIEDERNDLLLVPIVNLNQQEKSNRNSLDSLSDFIAHELNKLKTHDNQTSQG